MGFLQRKYSTTATTSTNSIVLGPVDVSVYEKFCVVAQLQTATAALSEFIVQASITSSATAAGAAPEWFNVSTATLPIPSALGITAIAATSAVDNCYHWLRFKAAHSASLVADHSAVDPVLNITIAGHTKY